MQLIVIDMKLNRTLALIVLASLLLTMICIPSNVQASPAAGWSSSATLLDDSTGKAEYPQIAMDGSGNAFFKIHRLFILLDVYAPADQLGGKAGVLAAFADRQ